MEIVIYRKKCKDMIMKVLDFIEWLHDNIDNKACNIRNGGRLVIIETEKDSIVIVFRCGDIRKLSGFRPDYYNCDCPGAVKMGGMEMSDWGELLSLIEKEYLEGENEDFN